LQAYSVDEEIRGPVEVKFRLLTFRRMLRHTVFFRKVLIEVVDPTAIEPFGFQCIEEPPRKGWSGKVRNPECSHKVLYDSIQRPVLVRHLAASVGVIVLWPDAKPPVLHRLYKHGTLFGRSDVYHSVGQPFSSAPVATLTHDSPRPF